MPAIEHRFSELLPGSLYLDTDVLVATLIPTDPLHGRAARLIERLIASTLVTRVKISTVSWLEYTNVIVLERFRASLTPEVRAQFQLDRWRDQTVRQTYLTEAVRRLDALFAQLSFEEVSLTPAIRAESV